MTPTPEQVHQALLNYYRPLRTNGSKVKDALEHVKTSHKKSPGSNQGSNSLTAINDVRHKYFRPPSD